MSRPFCGMHAWVVVGVAVMSTGCPPSIRRPESSQLVVTGSLVAGGFSKRGEALTNATVTLRKAEGGESLASNVSSNAGGYLLSANVTPGLRVLFVAEAPGFAPYVKAFTVGPFTELNVSAALSPLERWECLDTSCTAPLIDLEWADPPMGASGAVTTFGIESTLKVDLDGHPALLALGYAELDGGAMGTLHLRVPLQNWASIVDARPGSGEIEVEAATFDVTSATWTRLPVATLLSENGLPLPEGSLGTIQRAEHAGGVVVPLPVASGRFIAVLGAAIPVGCVQGTLEAEGKPAIGATLSFRGFEPVAVGADGAFCVAGPVGGDPTPQRGTYAGLPYALGALKRATSPGVCGGSTCAAAGKLQLVPDALQVAQKCHFTGRVIDSMGMPVAAAEVVAIDESISRATVESFCGNNGARCVLTAASRVDGTFTMDGPFLTSMYVGAVVAIGTTAGVESLRTTGQFFETCPSEPLTLKLDRGLTRLEVTAAFTGSQLTWDPPRAASRLSVVDSTGVTKWAFQSAVGFTPPVTFGSLPAAALEQVTALGSPSSGDVLEVELQGMGRDGVLYVGGATATRP